MKRTLLVLTTAFFVLFALVSAASAQYAVSAKSGLINYSEGSVKLNGADLVRKAAAYPRVAAGSELRTLDDGRAEVLMGDGVFVWVAEDSAFQMISDRLEATKIELLSGSFLIEATAGDQYLKDGGLTAVVKGNQLSFPKHGVYRIDVERGTVRAYDGEVLVTQAGQMTVVKGGKLLVMNGVSLPEKFDVKTGDALYRWARRRSEYLAMANVTAARSRSTGWVYNPYFDLFTFVPYQRCRNFWGYQFWSPDTVYQVYYRPVYNSGSSYNSGYNSYSSANSYGSSGTYAGTSGSMATSSSSSVTQSNAGGSASGTGVGASGGASAGGRGR